MALWQEDEAQSAEAKRIGQRLKWAREGHDMSRVQLALHVGVDAKMIRHMEVGERVPSIFLAMSLCHILGISPQYLLWGILQGCEQELAARLAREHPELTIPRGPIVHGDMPNPGKTRRSQRSIDLAGTG